MQVVNVTTPANLFHVLRRQLKRDFRKPLIIFTPKSLLRHPSCVSEIEDFSTGGFKEVIDDSAANPDNIKKVILCSGKIYYELLEEQEKLKNKDTAIVRLEQIYPLPVKQLNSIIEKYENTESWLWVQEEPINMGAWTFINQNFKQAPIKVIARPASGSPATGSSKFHQLTQKKIIDKAFHKCECPKLEEECEMVCIGNRWKSFEKEISSLKDETLDSKTFSANKKL